MIINDCHLCESGAQIVEHLCAHKPFAWLAEPLLSLGSACARQIFMSLPVHCFLIIIQCSICCLAQQHHLSLSTPLLWIQPLAGNIARLLFISCLLKEGIECVDDTVTKSWRRSSVVRFRAMWQQQLFFSHHTRPTTAVLWVTHMEHGTYVCVTQVPHCGTQTETHCLVQLIVTHFYSMGNITHIKQIPHYSRLAS